MDSTDAGITLQKDALDKVTTAFKNAPGGGYALHFDVGDLFGSASATNHNLDNTSHKVPFADAIVLDVEVGKENFYKYKALYMNIAKRNIFHYLLMANTQNGSGGSSGSAEINGNDVLITLGE